MYTHRSILFILIFTSFLYAQKQIHIDYQQSIGTFKNLCGVNRGPGERLDGYKQGGVTAIRLHDERASDYYNYTDFWNFDHAARQYTTINSAFDPSNPDHYHWQNLDALIAPARDNDIHIYFRIGVSWPENTSYPTPPLTAPLDSDGKGYVNFAELCKRTAMHYNDQWDNGYRYKIQYWEIWNEPGGIFWNGSPQQFYKMYQAASLVLKQHDNQLKVGAPGAVPSTIVIPKPEYFDNFLQYVSENNLPLDFYSWHLYGAENPYGLKYWAEIVRQKLDSFGLTQTESHVTEINYNLHEGQELMDDNARGAAYYLSTLLSAQESPIDQFYWYPGLSLFEEDSQGKAQFKCNAYGLYTYHQLYTQTPEQIKTTGSELVDGHWQADTTNMIVAAGKTKDKVYIALSNYNSSHQQFTIHLDNLPFTANDQIKITRNIITQDQKNFPETTSMVKGAAILDMKIENLPSPSLALLRIEKQKTTPVENSHNRQNSKTAKFKSFPNPFNAVTCFHYSLEKSGHVTLQLYDVNGKHVETLINTRQNAGQHSTNWNALHLPSGIYFVKLKTRDRIQIDRILFIK